VWRARKANAEIVEVDLKSAVMQIADGRGMRCRFLRIAKIGGFKHFDGDLSTLDARSLNPSNEAADKVWMAQQFGGFVKGNANVTKSGEVEVSFLGQGGGHRLQIKGPMSPNSLTIGWNSSGQITPSTG
jgi:hypothetical protein